MLLKQQKKIPLTVEKKNAILSTEKLDKSTTTNKIKGEMKTQKSKMSHNTYYKLGKFEYFGGFKIGDFRLLLIVTKSADEMQARWFQYDGWCIVQRVGENFYFPVTPFLSALQEVPNNEKK